MNQQTTIVTVIDGLGNVEVANDLASFSLILRAKNENLRQATEMLNEKTKSFSLMMEKFKGDLEGEIEQKASNFKLEHREGGEKIAAGFQVCNVIQFTVLITERLDDLFAALSSFDKDLFYPTYSLRNSEKYSKEAMDLASKNLKEKLIQECALLGVSPDALKIQSWHFGYDGSLNSLNAAQSYRNSTSYGVTGSTGATGPTGVTGLNRLSVQKIASIYSEELNPRLIPGSTSFSIAIRANYIWA